MTASDAELRLQRQAAAHKSWANTPDRAARMAKAREARQRTRYLKLVDPDGVLPEAEREQRAAALRDAEMADMARKAAKSRRLAREAQAG